MKRDTDRLSIGSVIALIGSAGLMVALFRPWYSLHIPPPSCFRRPSAKSLQVWPRPGAIRPGDRGGAAQQLAAHPPTVNAWQAFEYLDVALSCICAAVASLTLARCLLPGASLPGLHSIVTALGLMATGLVVFRIAHHPGSGDTFAGHALLRLESGAWLALVAAGAMALGGILAAPRRTAAARHPAAPTRNDWSATGKTWAGS